MGQHDRALPKRGRNRLEIGPIRLKLVELVPSMAHDEHALLAGLTCSLVEKWPAKPWLKCWSEKASAGALPEIPQSYLQMRTRGCQWGPGAPCSGRPCRIPAHQGGQPQKMSSHACCWSCADCGAPPPSSELFPASNAPARPAPHGPCVPERILAVHGGGQHTVPAGEEGDTDNDGCLRGPGATPEVPLQRSAAGGAGALGSGPKFEAAAPQRSRLWAAAPASRLES